MNLMKILGSLLSGVALATLWLGPSIAMAAPPAVTASSATVTVNPTTGAVVYPLNRQLIQTFTAATQAAAVPTAANQLGFETDTRTLYYATGASAGSWSPLIPVASETTRGLIELATQAEVTAGADTTRAVTPATMKGTLNTVLENENSGFRISSNGANGYKLELWNADQDAYQEIRLAGAEGAERLVIVAAP